jgi:SpoVK/Ycf46/Vps4 family AAA+-type ATPase
MVLSDLIIYEKEKVSLDDIFLDSDNKQKLAQLLQEHTYIYDLLRYTLPVNNKVLLHGSSGCGKTTTAKAIATALNKNLIILNLSNIVCSRIGETSQNMKMVFDTAAREKAVLFLDEFDQIGKARNSDDKDVGEMRRIVNTILQLIDYYPHDALLICATNYQTMIDPALLRRFQLNISFTLPDAATLDLYYDKLLAKFPEHLQQITRQYGFSFAEARDYTYTGVKALLIKTLEIQQNIRIA